MLQSGSASLYVHGLARTLGIIALALVPFTFLARSAAGELYTIRNIIDTSGEFEVIGQPASINNDGVVAFKGILGNGSEGIFTSDGVNTNTIITNAAPQFRFLGGVPVINNHGVVTFIAREGPQPQDGLNGVYTSSGGAPTTIVTSNGKFRSFARSYINDEGRVSIRANLDNDDEGIFTYLGGTETTVFTTSGNIYSSAQINEDGNVVFIEGVTGNVRTLYYGNGGPLTTIATSQQGYEDIQQASINDNNQVMFVAFDEDRINGIYSGDGNTVSLILDTNGPYEALGSPSMFGDGSYVFGGRLDDGTPGIFTGPDPEHDTVLKIGDELFGSTVETFRFSHSIGDRGEIAFQYDLANGISGIAVASIEPVPEPASMLVWGLGGAATLVAARRKRRRARR